MLALQRLARLQSRASPVISTTATGKELKNCAAATWVWVGGAQTFPGGGAPSQRLDPRTPKDHRAIRNAPCT